VEVCRHLKKQLQFQLRDHGPGWLLCLAPLAAGGFLVALVAPTLAPPKPQLDPQLLQAMLKDPPAPPQAQPASQLPGPGVEPPKPTAPGPTLEIRVMLHQGQPQAQVGAEGPWQLRLRDGAIWRNANGYAPIACGPQGLTLSGESGPLELWLQAAAGSVQLNGSSYRGQLRLFCEGKGLTVVNHLPMEDYIASVVGAEMPSHWPNEALRAQAVAARSYALVHMARPADPHWNLGATTRWQAYQGLASESGPSRAAVEATSGLILSYQGGIVESLYASDRQLAFEAHGHLGASMSQQGARMLAQKGFSYGQILSTYYRGARLARLRSSP